MTHTPCSLVPENVTACVDAVNLNNGRYYELYKDGRLLVIQAGAGATISLDPNYIPDSAAIARMDKEMLDILEVIQHYLDDLKFDKNWAFLIPQRGGSYAIEYRDHPISINCRTLARLVDQKDIQITKWLHCGQRHGIWKNKPVDLMIAWNNEFMKMVEFQTNGHYLLRSMDLTFEVLGHVTANDQIIGLMTEPAEGRFIEYGDRAHVYDAVAKLESNNICIDCLMASNIMISNGKVRFVSVSSARLYNRDEPGCSVSDTQPIQFNKLKRLFDSFSDSKRTYACVKARSLSQQMRIIPRLPKLCRTPADMTTSSDFMVRFVLYARMSNNDWLRKFGSTGSKSQRTERPRRGQNLLLCPSSPQAGEIYDPDETDQIVDKPLMDRYLLVSRVTCHEGSARAVSHPYNRHNSSTKLLLGHDDTDSTIDGD